jgi:ribonuclease R
MTKKSKKQDRLFENLLRVTYEYVKGKHYSPQTKETLIERLKIHPEHIAVFEGALKSLHDTGKVRESSGKILPSVESRVKQPDLIQGKLSVHPRGFGFVESPDPNEPDIFIPKPYMNDAIDGDIVEVLINRETISEKGPEGKILSIITRSRTQLVGTVWAIRNNEAFAFCQVLGEKHLVKIKQLSQKKKQTKTAPLVIGDRVVLDVLSWGKKSEPTISTLAKRIGHISDPSTDIPASILEQGIRTEFPKEVVQEAAAFGTKVTKKDLEEREDLRHLECFTIDPDTAKDYDDALSLEKTASGYLLGVHIADVSHYVKAGSHLDREAQERCNSTYFPGKCIPMLPSELSDHLCSLRQGVLRLTVSVFVDIDKEGNTKSWRICRSVIKSQKRFTYKNVKKIFDKKLKSKHEPTLQRMLHLCNLLKDKRSERGSVQLYMPELTIRVDQHGMPQDTELIEYDITHQMVEEFMLKANEIVAIELTKQGKNAGFRVHEEPSKESLREFSALTKAFGFSLSQEPTPQEIQQMFSEIEVNATSQYLATCYIRSMRLACYSADNIGHYGLSLEHYCHFTSPIRRYVDTIIHRLLFEKNVEKDFVVKLCKQASDKERLSAKAESSVIHMKKLRLLDMLAAKHKYRQFEAVVTRVKPFGIYFDVLELMLEGFLHVSELDNDFFDYVDNSMCLLGRYQGISYKSGDRLHVMLGHIDLIQRECSWQLVTHSAFEPMSLEKVKKPHFDKEIADFLKRKSKSKKRK